MDTSILDVSVVIPTIGRPELARALASVRCQSVRCREVIVVLDRPSARKDVNGLLHDGETLLVTDGGVGGGSSRNIGLDHAQGRYVAFLDDDDWWEPTKAETQYRALEDAGATFSYTSTAFVGDGPLRVLPEDQYAPPDSIAAYLVRRPGLRHGAGYMQTSSLVIRTDLAKKVRWDPSFRKHQDWDFVVRVFADESCVYVFCPAPLVKVAQGTAGSISKRPDWRASLDWYLRHGEGLDRRSSGDFVTTQIIRSSLGTLDLEGLRTGIRLISGTRPHFASWVVACFGLIEWGRRARHK